MEKKQWFVMFILGMSLLFSSTAHAAEWSINTVDSDDIAGQSSLALDSKGNPHISYRSVYVDTPDIISELNYARRFARWHLEKVASGVNSSLALDSNDNPHISYYDAISKDLKYAYFDGDWHTETVDSSGEVGGDPSLALDSNDNPHISYNDLINRKLKYAYFDGVWHIETVDNSSEVRSPSSLALSSGGNPHISYYDDSSSTLKYAKYLIIINPQPPATKIWTKTTVDSALFVGRHSSIALDSNNKPHISYWDSANKDLKYAHYDSAWHTETVDSNSAVGEYSSLALDSADNPHISYFDATDNDLKYVYYDGTWHSERVDTDGEVGTHTSLALDSRDNPHISYFSMTGSDLKYTRKIRSQCLFSALFEERSQELAALKHFRDGVLVNTSAGVNLIRLYYQHGGNFIALLEKHPGLKACARRFTRMLLPYLQFFN